jgi:hypothetical protein
MCHRDEHLRPEEQIAQPTGQDSLHPPGPSDHFTKVPQRDRLMIVGKIVTRHSLLAAASSLAFVALVVGACRTERDPAMLEVVRSLVPEGSEVTEVRENIGPELEVGPYTAALLITEGGYGDELPSAIDATAVADGWEERYRCDTFSGTTFGYSRDEFTIDVSVILDEDPVWANIRIARAGEGNPWPPDCPANDP